MLTAPILREAWKEASGDRVCDPNALFAMMQRGDQQALSRIVTCFGDQLMRVGRRYCSSMADAEDAVQDVYLTTGEKMQSFRGDGSLEGWLVRMVINACRRMQRGRKNDPSLHRTDVELQSTSSPESRAARSELGDHLQRVLAELSNTDQLILMLVEGDGWTAKEVAEKLDMTHGAVRTRISRLRAALQKKLTQQNIFPD